MESYVKEALQAMFEAGLPAIVYEELTGDEYRPVDGKDILNSIIYHNFHLKTLI